MLISTIILAECVVCSYDVAYGGYFDETSLLSFSPILVVANVWACSIIMLLASFFFVNPIRATRQPATWLNHVVAMFLRRDDPAKSRHSGVAHYHSKKSDDDIQSRVQRGKIVFDTGAVPLWPRIGYNDKMLLRS